jgi:hypothetical protein
MDRVLNAELVCAVPGCGRPVCAKGWCRLHYDRVRLTGQPGPVDPIVPGPPDPCAVTVRRRQARAIRSCRPSW